MGGGMDVKPNKHLEEWLLYREDMQKYFRFNRRTTAISLIFGVAVPVLVYNLIVDEFHKQDILAGKPRREFVGIKGDYK